MRYPTKLLIMKSRSLAILAVCNDPLNRDSVYGYTRPLRILSAGELEKRYAPEHRKIQESDIVYATIINVNLDSLWEHFSPRERYLRALQRTVLHEITHAVDFYRNASGAEQETESASYLTEYLAEELLTFYRAIPAGQRAVRFSATVPVTEAAVEKIADAVPGVYRIRDKRQVQYIGVAQNNIGTHILAHQGKFGPRMLFQYFLTTTYQEAKEIQRDQIRKHIPPYGKK